MFFFRYFGFNNIRKSILIQYGKFMKCTGSGNIQQFDMPVILWILFFCRIPQKYRVKFQSLRIHDRENHNSLSELTAFRCVALQIQTIPQKFRHGFGFRLIATDHGDRFVSVFLPFLNLIYCCVFHSNCVRTGFHFYLRSVTNNRFHRINREISMPENFRGKF